MKIYPNVDANLFVQSNGSDLLMVIKGYNEEQIELLYNSLFNFGATADTANLDYADHNKTVATFRSNPDDMKRYFRNLFFFRNVDKPEYKGKKGGIKADMDAYAEAQFALLQKESGITHDPHKKTVLMPEYGRGKLSAERPDTDFRDAVLSHAYADRSSGKDE